MGRVQQIPRLTKLGKSRKRFACRMDEILNHATEVFYEKGYEAASMRDLSRATGLSLAGLYHYFDSKETLLYLIQKHTFSTVLEKLRQTLRTASDSEERVRRIVANHLTYFITNQKAMTVLSHEDEVLTGALGEEVRGIKRAYFQLCRDVVEQYKAERGLTFNTRVAVLSLFGMMNWIYTWYRPHRDADAATLAREMGDIFLRGVGGAEKSLGVSPCTPDQIRGDPGNCSSLRSSG